MGSRTQGMNVKKSCHGGRDLIALPSSSVATLARDHSHRRSYKPTAVKEEIYLRLRCLRANEEAEDPDVCIASVLERSGERCYQIGYAQEKVPKAFSDLRLCPHPSSLQSIWLSCTVL